MPRNVGVVAVSKAAKEFFQQIRLIDKQIDMKFEQLERLEALATKVTATMSDTTGKPSGVSRSMENSVDKIIDLKNELYAEIKKLTDLKRDAYMIIRQLRNEKYRICLESRYLLGKTWEAIACDLGMSYQGVCYLHGKALQEAEKIFPKTTDT